MANEGMGNANSGPVLIEIYSDGTPKRVRLANGHEITYSVQAARLLAVGYGSEKKNAKENSGK